MVRMSRLQAAAISGAATRAGVAGRERQHAQIIGESISILVDEEGGGT